MLCQQHWPSRLLNLSASLGNLGRRKGTSLANTGPDSFPRDPKSSQMSSGFVGPKIQKEKKKNPDYGIVFGKNCDRVKPQKSKRDVARDDCTSD